MSGRLVGLQPGWAVKTMARGACGCYGGGAVFARPDDLVHSTREVKGATVEQH